MKNKLFLFISLFLLLPVILPADDNSRNEKAMDVSIDKAVSMALSNNLSLMGEKLNQQGRTWHMIASLNTLFPSLSASGTLSEIIMDTDQKDGINKQLEFSEDYDGEKISDWAMSANFNLRWNLNAGLGHGIYYKVLEWKKGRITLDQAKKQIELKIKQAYYQLVLQKEEITVRESSLQVAKKRFDKANVEFNAGIIPEVQLLSIQLGYENQKPGLLQTRSNYRQNLLLFKQMVGINKDMKLNFVSDIEIADLNELNIDKLESKNIKENLNLKSLKVQLEQLSSLRTGLIISMIPSFSLGFTYTREYDSTKNPRTAMSDLNLFADTEEDWKKTNGATSFTISVPIGEYIPLSAKQMQIIDSQMALVTTKLKYEDLQQNLEIQLQNSIMQIETAVETVNALMLSVKVAKKSLELAEIAYEAGAKSYQDVEEEEVKYRDAQVKLLNAKYGYILSLLNLEFLLNETINFK